MNSTAGAARPATWRAIPGGIWALGFVSLFMDLSSEMIHSLLPIFLVTVLGASPIAVGLIEGIAEATASITKVFSGTLSDYLGRRKFLVLLFLTPEMHHGSYRLMPQHKVWLESRNRFVVGDGGMALLRAIAATGSIRAAVGEVGWSYRHALGYLDNAERALGYPLIERARGGHERGGAALTARGHALVRRYTRFRTRLDRALQTFYRSAFDTDGS